MPTKTANPKKTLATLYTNIAKDAEFVARREKRYALQAKNERKFAGKDALMAKKKNQGSRLADDKLEYQICIEFYRDRMTVSKFYVKRAKHYRTLAKEARGK